MAKPLILVTVWLVLDYPWGLLALAISALYGPLAGAKPVGRLVTPPNLYSRAAEEIRDSRCRKAHPRQALTD